MGYYIPVAEDMRLLLRDTDTDGLVCSTISSYISPFIDTMLLGPGDINMAPPWLFLYLPGAAEKRLGFMPR